MEDGPTEDAVWAGIMRSFCGVLALWAVFSFFLIFLPWVFAMPWVVLKVVDNARGLVAMHGDVGRTAGLREIILGIDFTDVGIIIGFVVAISMFLRSRADLKKKKWFLLGGEKRTKLLSADSAKFALRSLLVFFAALISGFIIELVVEPSKMGRMFVAPKGLTTSGLTTDSLFISSTILLLTVAVSAYGVSMQVRASVLSKNRQAWIDSLRNHIADAITQIGTISSHLDEFRKNNSVKNRSVLHKCIIEFRRTRSIIRMLINPMEEDHASLVKMMDSFFENELTPESLRKASNVDLDTIIYLSQKILKREWERVKGLE